MPTTIDVEKELKRLYRARQTPELVDVPELSFLMIDGHGDPNTSGPFQQAVQALYAVFYTLKFALKRAGETDYRVGPLEGLWWAEDITSFGLEDKSAYHWTLIIRQPEQVTPELVAQAMREVKQKKHLVAADELRFELFAEGRSAQVLHLGPYAAEAPTIEGLQAFIADQGWCDAASTTRSTSAIPAAAPPSA